MIIYCELSHWKLWFSSPLCKRLPEVTSHKIPLNHHFPMVFLWFSKPDPFDQTSPWIRSRDPFRAFSSGISPRTWSAWKMTGFRCRKLERFNSKIQIVWDLMRKRITSCSLKSSGLDTQRQLFFFKHSGPARNCRDHLCWPRMVVSINGGYLKIHAW